MPLNVLLTPLKSIKLTISHDRTILLPNFKTNFMILQPDIYSPFLYDAVYMYAKILQQHGGDPDAVNGTTVTEETPYISFKGNHCRCFPYLQISLSVSMMHLHKTVSVKNQVLTEATSM